MVLFIRLQNDTAAYLKILLYLAYFDNFKMQIWNESDSQSYFKLQGIFRIQTL